MLLKSKKLNEYYKSNQVKKIFTTFYKRANSIYYKVLKLNFKK